MSKGKKQGKKQAKKQAATLLQSFDEFDDVTEETAPVVKPAPADKQRKPRAANPSHFNSERARLAIYTRHANTSPEQASAQGKHAAAIRWQREAERRAAAGEPPLKKSPPRLSADDLLYWLEQVDERFPDTTWPSDEARKRRAVLLARQSAAEDALKQIDRNA